MNRQEKRREENGKVFIDVITVETYEEITKKYPLGLQRTVRVKVADPKPAPEAQAQIVIPKKRGIIAVILAVILGALGIKAFNAAKQDDEYQGFDTDNDDFDEEDYDDDEDDSSDSEE